MLTLLFVVLVCGVLAFMVNSIDIPQSFKVIAIGILIIIILAIFFQTVLGVNTHIPLR